MAVSAALHPMHVMYMCSLNCGVAAREECSSYSGGRHCLDLGNMPPKRPESPRPPGALQPNVALPLPAQKKAKAAAKASSSSDVWNPEEVQDEPKNTGTVRKWIGRWRRKWNGKLGRVRTQCGGDVEKVSGKAGDLKRFKNLKKVIRLGPKNGPVFRAQIRAL